MSTTSSKTIQVLLPELGESVTEGVIVEWRVGEGERVEAGDTLLEVTTDKVDVEIPAPASGVLARIVARPGDAVEVGALLAEMREGAEGGGNGSPSPSAEAPPAPEAAGRPSGGGDGGGPAGAVPIVLPDMESVTEGVVVEWRVAVGEPVAAEQTVVEVSTDKVDLEVPAPAAGVLASIAVPAGETFTVGQPLGEIAVAGGAAPAAPERAPAEAPPARSGAPRAPAPAPPAADLEWPRVSPLARRLAHERGVDLRSVAGSGPGGMIRRSDVPAAAEGHGAPAAASAAAVPVAAPGEEAQPLRGPAAALAAYMDESLSIPTATSVRTLPVGALDAQRRRINQELAAAGRREKLSFTHLIAWAVVRAAQAHPVMNTAYERRDGTPHRLVREVVNLGLAVDVERRDGSRSLLVPVVRDAGGLGFRGFRDAYDDLVGRTRAGQVKPDELRGATMTLTNPGGLGTVASIPRLMPGQGTIVATGAIGYPAGLASARPDALRDLGVEKVMTMTSTYDHRVIQGAESGAFLGEVERLLAGADEFYEEVRESLGLSRAAAPEEAPAAPTAAPAAAPGAVDAELLEAVAAAMSVVKAHRSHGHLAARLDPLGSEPPGDPALEPANVGLTPELMARIPAGILRVKVPGESFAAALPHLREAYCGTIAYEIEHLSDHQKRLWLRAAIESGRMRDPLPAERRVQILERLVQVDAFERFLRRTYLGQKTFSIEGVDALVPITDEVIELVAGDGAAEVVLGMAHRGRLAFITHVVGRQPESILAEFEGHMAFESGDEELRETAGDVKYHLGAEGTYLTRGGRPVTVKLAANPSHLEQVNAVAEGHTRARQTNRSGRRPQVDPMVAVPVLIHGDAAFTGQGVVAETLNLQALAGYSTGGTVHIIANNQIGFTTDPNDSRSTYHVSDLARGFDIPVIHVNADDIDACITAARIAVAYRQRYRRDVLINLIGYRRLGHNELDEPAYTQPVMTRTIKAHPPVSKIYAKRLVDEGVIGPERVEEMIEAAERRMREAHERVTGLGDTGAPDEQPKAHQPRPQRVETAVPADVLRSLNEQLLTVPDGFTIHPKLLPQLERRREALGADGGITWAHAEALAFASLLTEGIPIRLTGQDTARGTFSQRHLELHDMGEGETWTPRTGRVWVPMANLPRAAASLELHNSPLSEAAAVGFEYGYSTQAPEALVLWEAQYGDFANGAQIMIDQFIVSGRAKWGEASRLTLLLPHGYEGNGPEHSSARIERFLQLAAEDNIRVANCSTAANYFHLLRKQALTERQRPLIIFTPKSLLRARSAASRLEDLSEGGFLPVIDDPRAEGRRDAVTRLILCSGKVFHELDAHPDRASREELAIARVEMLYPFPEEQVAGLLTGYPRLERVTWVQEEPRNMGAWEFVRLQLERLLPDGVPLGYTGRARRASPSEGYPQAHQAEQERLLNAAINPDRGGGE